jgi:putative transcriptional regulator
MKSGLRAAFFRLNFGPERRTGRTPARSNPEGSIHYNRRRLTMAEVNLTHHFLIAMPNMADPYFARSLTYLCEHNDQGALGIVVNRPIDMTLAALFERLELKAPKNGLANAPVYFGGPVQTDRGFVLHQPVGQWQATLAVRDRLGLTTSRDILEAVQNGTGPERIIVSLGYSGWSAGQLENEIKQNAWLTVEAQDDILFDLPAEERLAAAMDLLGVDFATLSEEAGHA